MAKDRIGFIGLGAMGAPMARQIVASGAAVTVYDVSAESVAALVEAGARAAATPREAAEQSDIVICMLPHPDVVRGVLLGPDGVVHADPAPQLAIDMSTSGPEVVRECAAALAESGIGMLDAPVGKGPWAAEKGELTILLGGPDELCAKAEPVLRVVGSTVLRCGPLGAGQAVKLANNLVACANMAAVTEGYALAKRAGADPAVLLEMMPGTSADSWQLRHTMIGKIMQGDLSPMFKLQLAHKDMRLVLELASGSDLDVGCAKATYEWYDAAMRHGYGDHDWGAIALVADPDLAPQPPVGDVR
ncbi:MAG: NAD(P)-dependent oxidoreductase [Micromonosporaceae bacterium]